MGKKSVLQVNFRENVGPDTLQNIQKHWALRAKQYGDKGSCVLGAGFKFLYENKVYFMRENSFLQGNLSWETSKDEIKQFLESAGATDIYYEWGRMD